MDVVNGRVSSQNCPLAAFGAVGCLHVRRRTGSRSGPVE